MTAFHCVSLTEITFAFQVNTGDQPHDRVRREQPPPSQFQHLGPSRNRYTLLHDEF